MAGAQVFIVHILLEKYMGRDFLIREVHGSIGETVAHTLKRCV